MSLYLSERERGRVGRCSARSMKCVEYVKDVH